MKKHWLICMLPFALAACKKEKPVTPPDPQVAIIGTWKETAIYNSTYDRGVLTGIDTLSAMTSGAAMYTDFLPGGTYEAYTLTGNTHTDRVFDHYSYSPEISMLGQNWPAKNINGNRTNVNHVKEGAAAFENSANINSYTIISLNERQLILSEKLLVFGYEGSGLPYGYITQTRVLTRQ
ncbi:hypothetical protein HQ865_05445 [Mucilaginibacter mali]|uniref:Lipocalin-like domain-containing protein n=1 Tax=Mucilaginibacter mali TaxID=2740462 RepID=A0A7D4UCE0_9SPHI|nr:hypothetical protein [Mucilaginibacter mali]QKJ29219.1 hypothetical protein HQ865_05445 [Mucilaginibacter mali]